MVPPNTEGKKADSYGPPGLREVGNRLAGRSPLSISWKLRFHWNFAGFYQSSLSDRTYSLENFIAAQGKKRGILGICLLDCSSDLQTEILVRDAYGNPGKS